MTASDIKHWKMPMKDMQTLAARSRPKQPKKTVASKPSGDRSDKLEDALPKPGKDASADTHKRRSTHLSKMVRVNFLGSNPYLLMDSIGMYKAATCWIHLSDDNPYEELLNNADEVKTLIQDLVVLAATH